MWENGKACGQIARILKERAGRFVKISCLRASCVFLKWTHVRNIRQYLIDSSFSCSPLCANTPKGSIDATVILTRVCFHMFTLVESSPPLVQIYIPVIRFLHLSCHPCAKKLCSSGAPLVWPIGIALKYHARLFWTTVSRRSWKGIIFNVNLEMQKSCSFPNNAFYVLLALFPYWKRVPCRTLI